MKRESWNTPDIPPQTAQHTKLGLLEKMIEPRLFRHRIIILLAFILASVFFAYHAANLRIDASLQKMVPANHPFITNSIFYENELRPLGNVVRIAVEARHGDIYSKAYLETLKKITDEVFYIPGVDRGNMKSLWTPNVVWLEMTEEGMTAGRIIPEGLDDSPEKLDIVRTNVERSGTVGSLVANDRKSAMILVPLLEVDPQTGNKLDYGAFSDKLEERIRTQYASKDIQIHITGFAKVVGDLIQGGRAIGLYFLLTFALTTVLLYAYSRCWRSTLATLLCCSLAMIWQLGIIQLLGFGLDPYSMLVPFLTFAIGVSHAVQNINTMAMERAKGRSNIDAAKQTFRMLFIPGSVALICDAVGFSTLLVIDIGVIRELAIGASVGVLTIILTKMFLLPLLMSYVGVSEACIRLQRKKDNSQRRVARALSKLAEPRQAKVVALLSVLLFAGAWYCARDVKIGDLEPGAPELRTESRYNRDSDFIVSHYSTSPDVFVVMVKSQPETCGSYPVAAAVDRFQATMENVEGVESTASLFNAMKKMIAGSNGGNLKWSAITRNRFVSNAAHRSLPSEFFNTDCSMTPVLVFLSDHKAATLTRVVTAVEQFAAKHNDEKAQFIMAAGNAGIEAATNIVIKRAETQMLLLVYGIVAILVLWEFRSWRVTVAIIVPLFLTSVLCEAVMAKLGLGVKVATLPVIALGVGIGVDYGIYLYNRLEHFLGQGMGLVEAYFETLKSTGSAVMLTGITLALGVAVWTFSEIKFQADMGLLLAFMFLWNMVGAIVMIPALIALLSPKPAGVPQAK